MLADPASCGANAADAFDVIVPSLPGYGFSDRPTESGVDTVRIADIWIELMKELGYSRGYEYDHNAEEGFSGQNYFPDGMAREEFYQPVERGFEREVQKRLEYWKKLREKRRQGS